MGEAAVEMAGEWIELHLNVSDITIPCMENNDSLEKLRALLRNSVKDVQEKIEEMLEKDDAIRPLLEKCKEFLEGFIIVKMRRMLESNDHCKFVLIREVDCGLPQRNAALKCAFVKEERVPQCNSALEDVVVEESRVWRFPTGTAPPIDIRSSHI